MYKLCLALAFVAVAAAKPNWPLTYPSVYSSAYPAYGAAYYSGAPGYPGTYPLVAKSFAGTPVAGPLGNTIPVATSYSYNTGVVKPVVAPAAVATPVAAPVATPVASVATFPGAYPYAYSAAFAPVAPVSGYSYRTPFAWKKK